MSATKKHPTERDPMLRRRRIMAVQLAALIGLALICAFLVFEAMRVG